MTASGFTSHWQEAVYTPLLPMDGEARAASGMGSSLYRVGRLGGAGRRPGLRLTLEPEVMA